MEGEIMFELANSFDYFLDEKKKEDEIIYNYVKDKFENNGSQQRVVLICKTENELTRKKTEMTMKQYFVVFEVKDFEFYKLDKDENFLIVDRNTYERLKYEKGD